MIAVIPVNSLLRRSLLARVGGGSSTVLVTRAKLLNSTAGFSLIELVVAMIIIAVSVGGFISVIGGIAIRSSNPEFKYEALNIAESYMAEVLSHNRIQRADGTCAAGGLLARAIRSSVCDYNGTNERPRGRNGSAIRGLGSYTVTVNVRTGGGDSDGDGVVDSELDGLGGASDNDVARIDITVSRSLPSAASVTLHSYKTSCATAAANLALPGSC